MADDKIDEQIMFTKAIYNKITPLYVKLGMTNRKMVSISSLPSNMNTDSQCGK